MVFKVVSRIVLIILLASGSLLGLSLVTGALSDSDVLAYIERSPKGGLYLLDVSNRVRFHVADTGLERETAAVHPRWSPDGKKLAYYVDANTEVDLVVSSLYKRDDYLLTEDDEIEAYGSVELLWSPDSEDVLLFNLNPMAREFYQMQADGTTYNIVTQDDNIVQYYLETIGPEEQLYDGKRLYSFFLDGAFRLFVDDEIIYTFEQGQAYISRTARWSPDGKRITFVSYESGNPYIYIINADGSSPRRLLMEPAFNPVWKPA